MHNATIVDIITIISHRVYYTAAGITRSFFLSFTFGFHHSNNNNKAKVYGVYELLHV